MKKHTTKPPVKPAAEPAPIVIRRLDKKETTGFSGANSA